MTNNLAKIAKDLRAFAKRCKDVHYSDSLLISFILSGILSLASISFSDTFDNLSDSQKEAAMDSINEMRQQINYARKDNDKLIKGSSLELVKLMEQGDQVVKSPWGSQQFGFGYTYNSWGTSFKGRGGKQNDIKYRRTNDLTKYVFDPNLHEYGATNLHIQRNKEPDALVINPANVHKSYTPPTVAKLDSIVMPNEVAFNVEVAAPKTVEYSYTNPSYTYSATSTVAPTTQNIRKSWGTDAIVSLNDISYYGNGSYYNDNHYHNDRDNYSGVSSGHDTSSTVIEFNNTTQDNQKSSYTNGNRYKISNTSSVTNGTFNNREVDEGRSQTTAWTNRNNYTIYERDVNGHVNPTSKTVWWSGSGSHYASADVTVGGSQTIAADDLQYSTGQNYWGVVYATAELNAGHSHTDIPRGHSGSWDFGEDLIVNSVTYRLNGNEYVGADPHSATNIHFDARGMSESQIVDTIKYLRAESVYNYEGLHNGDNYSVTTVHVPDPNAYPAKNSASNAYGNLSNVGTTGGSEKGHRATALYVGKGISTSLNNVKFNVNDIDNINDGGSATRIDGQVTDATSTIINLGRNSAGVVLDVSDHYTRNPEITFTGSNYINLGGDYRTSIGGNFLGASGVNFGTIEGASGGNNIAFNIQDGVADGSREAKIEGPVELNFESNYNVGYNLTNYVKKLTIKNTGGNNHSSGIDLNGAYNVVYAGQGIADTGSAIKFEDVYVFGDKNTIIYLSSNSAAQNHPVGVGNTHGYNTNGNIGYFNGEIEVEAKIGEVLEEHQNATVTSQKTWANVTGDNANEVTGNVGVYAASGQRATASSYVNGEQTTSTSKVEKQNFGLANFTPNNVKIKDSNFRFGKYAKSNIGIYADNGSVIDVDSSGKTISDGLNDGTTGLSNTGSNNIMFYSEDAWDNNIHNLTSGNGLADMAEKGSQINVTAKDIIMTSHDSTTYSTKNKGIIAVTGDTKAQGKSSTIAYSDGLNSQIIINGKMIAADENLFNSALNSNPTLTADAFNNVGAYATTGGLVRVIGSAADSTKDLATKNSSTPYTAYADSMIYGIGAIATGDTGYTGIQGTDFVSSKVDFDGGQVTIATGKNGGLLALSNGLIEFTGNMINQDLRDIIPNLAGGNTHENVSPFYADSSENWNGVKNNPNSKSKIDFTRSKTNIYMHDGIVFTAYDNYNYYKDTSASEGTATVTPLTGDDKKKYDNATYRGMSNVTYNLEGGNKINLGLINNYDDAVWDNTGSTGKIDNYLASLTNYTGATITNNTANKAATNVYSTLINGQLKISSDVDLEDVVRTSNGATTPNDIFNNIKMESELVTIESGKTISGDVKYLAGQGLNMANSKSYNELDLDTGTRTWKKTGNNESGYINKGKINVWGGTAANNAAGTQEDRITGLNVAYGTAENNGSNATIDIDHGFGIYATDGSIINNLDGATITVTGKYAPSTTSTLRSTQHYAAETAPTGENYAIAGISDTNAVTYNKNGSDANGNPSGTTVNTLNIENKKSSIKVEGDLAVGIYGENRNNANANNVSIKYTSDSNKGIDVENTAATANNSKARGIGIALTNNDGNYNNSTVSDGGIITLNSFGGTLGAAGLTKNDILTGRNGIGIYGESVDVNLETKDFTVQTAEDGVGAWFTDDSHIATNANHNKTFQYNYQGSENGNGNAFAMAFGSTTSNNTRAQNNLDIKFSNAANTGITLAAANSGLTGTPSGTSKGIAGILVNTDAGDRVVNFGNIEEDKSSVTNVRAYGALVNKGIFENHGEIKLNDSLNELAQNVNANDLKKVNVGILANDHSKNARYNTFIENYNDITVGDVTTAGNKNVGGFAIYGYNVKTGKKEDGTNSVIKVNRNSYGIYSGDGNVDIQGTNIYVGNDTVLGHEQTTKGTSSAAGAYPINRQTAYTAATDLLPGRTTDAAVGVYIGSNENLSKQNRNVDVSANMDIDRYSYGIVLAENNGGATTNVTIGSPTYSPTINLASNTKAGGQVKSHVPTNPAIPEEVYEQGNAVYYYSADKNSKGTTYANITMNGDYNTAYRTAGSIDNHGIIDLRSQWDIANPTVDKTTGETINLGYGNLGIVSENPDIASTNYGKIITGMSDTQNMRYSAAMAAGRNVYDSNNTFVKTEADGYVINRGNIVVQAKDGIGMFATGSRSRAINYGNIELIGDNSTGMYLDRGAIGENYGTIEGSANNLRGVVAINGGYIKNYGTINVTGQNSNGIVTDSSRFIVDANGNPVKILSPTDAQYDSSQATTAGQNNGKDGSKDLYGGTESSIAEYTSGNPKTTGVGTTIAMPSVVPMTTITVDGVNTPIFTVDTDAATQGQWGEKISITSSIQTGGTRIIDLSQLDGWGNKMWNNYHTDQLSEVTSIGMYVDTSGVKYSNPINGIQNLKNLGEVNLYFGSEATLYTNAKAIRLGTNILKPFNDSLTNLPGGAVVNPLSASLTWQVAAKLDDKNQLTDVYMSKVPYHSFAFDDDTSLVNFTNNLDNVYEIVDFHTNEKEIFNKLNSLGNGEGHILAQAFDQMRAHIYGGIQQRTVATEKVFDSQVSGVMSSNGMVGNPSKDSTKYKAFGERGEYKTDTKGIPDYENYAGGFVAVHEGESIYKGEKHGWYTGVVDNNFSFKDIARSHENQAMIKGGLFKTTPFDVNGEFTWTIAGEGYFGRTDTNRRFWVVDKQYDAESHYYTYGVALKNELAKSFRLSEGFAIKPHVGIDLEYGRYSSFHEDGTMSLDVKGNDYHSIKPNLGVDFTYKQPVFKKSMFVASLGLGYEKELGRVNDVTNEARIQGAWTDYFSIRGDKENKKGNYKADLNLGIDNGRLGFTVNAGYDSTGKNFRGGAGLRFIF